MRAILRNNAVIAVLAFCATAVLAQTAANSGSLLMQSGTVDMSALPPFDAAALAERDEEEEAPEHSAVGDFPMPSRPQSSTWTKTTTATSSTSTSTLSPALTSSSTLIAAAAPASSFNTLTTPSPSVSFQAQPMLSNAPPDTTGAASPNYVMSVSNDEIVIQDRTGKVLKSTNLNNFWTAAFGSAISPAWDPNVRYDPYAQRWILVDMGAYSYAGSSMLIGVSATSDPTGTWYLRRFQSATNTTFDHPRVGFNANWIVVTGNQLDDTNGLNWIYSAVYVFNKADLYANGTKTPSFFTTTTNFTLTPALTYDNTVTTMYMMANYNGANGSLSLSTIAGPVDSPVVNFNVAFPTTTNTWASTVPSSFNQNFAPQLGSSTKIGVFDARMNTVVYRNGSLWATHTVFVPASTPTIAAVDWWQVGTDGTVQQFGRLQDPNGTYFYTYPSLAVNTNGDMLVGYSRMASSNYASGAYAFRAASDPAGTLRQEYVMSSGQGGGQNSYVHFDGNGVNRWGDYSSTQVDPVNDTDFWTVQEYAGTSGSAWGMWWDSVTAPNTTTAALQSISASPSSVTGGQSSTGTVTLTLAAPSGGISVNLSSSNTSAAQVPSSVSVPQGQTSATFTITTSAVTSATAVTISATYNGQTLSTPLTVSPPLALQSIAVSPTQVTGGLSANVTVTLNTAAPSGGISVALSSSNATVAPVPASITVPANSTTATVTINTTSVSSATAVTISATYNNVTQTANMTVYPPGGIPLSIVQAQQNFNSGSGTSITASISTTIGNLLVAYVREGSTSADNFTVTDNLGQTWTLGGYNSFSSVNRSGIFYIPNSKAVTSVTANFTTSGGVTRPGMIVYEIGGAASSSPVDVGPLSAVSTSSTTSLASAAMTTTNANDVLLYAVDVSADQSGTNNGFLPGAGFAFANGAATTTRQAMSYEIVSATQSNLKTSTTWATAGSSSSEFIAFKAPTSQVAAALQSVGVSPSAVTGGQSSTGTITLTSAAPTGGLVVNVSSNSSAAQVPSGGTVTVAQGATTATFTITTSTVTSATPVTISASYNGVTKTASLTVNPLPVLSSVTVNPTTVTGGQSSTGTITLSSATPTGGAVVTVSSNSTAAQVPSGGTVTVAQGATTATFTITTSAVSASTPVTITATYNNGLQTASLNVNPLTLQSLTVSPTTVAGGQSASGTVTLSGAAPTGGEVVSVSSNSSAAQVPAGGTVTVPAGSTSVSFPITTSTVTGATVVTISASYNGGTIQTASFTITPLAVVQARSAFNVNKASSISATISSTSGDLLVAYVREGSNATDNFTVTDNLGQTWTLAGYNSFNSNERSGIYYIANSGAVSGVTARFTTGGGVTRPGIVIYEIAGASLTSPVDAGPANNIFNSARTSITSASLSSTNANTIALFAVDLDTNQSGTNNSFVPAAGFAFPATGSATNTRQAVAYSIVSSVQTNLTTSMSWASSAKNGATQLLFFVPAPNGALTTQSISLNPSTLVGGQSSTATVTLTGAAPAGGAIVNVTSDSASAQVPVGGTVTVPEGATSATFSITTSAVSSATPVTISASYNGVTQSATLTLTAPASLQSVSVNPATVTGGQSSTGTITLSSAAPTGGAVVNVSSDSTAAQVPAGGTVAVPEGATIATFSITTSAVSSPTPVTISATYNGMTQTASLSLVAQPALQSLSLTPSTVTGGQTSTGTVTLTSAAPAGGAVITLSSNSGSAQVPAGGSVTVLEGLASTTFSITTSAVTSVTQPTISATYNGVTKTAILTVNPSTSLESIITNPSTITGGLLTTGTITLLGASSTQITVALASNNAAVQVPATVTLPANTSSLQFNITTSAVTASTPVTITASYNSGTATTTLTLTPPITATSTYTLSFSIAADRSSGALLQGVTLMGNAFVYTAPATQPANFNPSGISGVCYWLDNTAMSGTATHCESAVPYDYGSTSSTVSLANPWDTTTVADGPHTITQKVTFSNGSTEVDTASFTVQNTFSAGAISSGHYEYVFVDRSIYVYDLDNSFQLVKRVNLPQTNSVRGAGVVPGTHMLYISYGGDGGSNGNGSLLKYDLLTDAVVWTQNYAHGIDSFAVTPDGTTIYMPDGVNSTNDLWYIVDAATGNELGSISTGLNGPHNTVASLDGAFVFGGPRYSSYLAKIDTTSKSDVLNIGPLNPSVRPFTINGKHTLAFTTASNASGIGFQVSDTSSGAVLYTVTVPGFTIPSGFAGDTPNHGISLSPDEKEIYLMDSANAYVHVYDVSGLPSSAPVLVANIPLTTSFLGAESPCAYDCAQEAWVLHTRDGHYVIVGDSGNVIDTTTRQVIGSIPELINTRRGFLEVDWQNGVPVFTTTHYGLGYVTQ